MAQRSRKQAMQAALDKSRLVLYNLNKRLETLQSQCDEKENSYTDFPTVSDHNRSV